MSFNYALADHGRTFATRFLGEQLRGELLREGAGQSSVVLDFSRVKAASHSFADEFVAHLAEEIERGELDLDVAVVGASEEVERVIRKALERRDVEIPVLV